MPFVPQGTFSFLHTNQVDDPVWAAATAKANFDSQASELKTTLNNLITAMGSITAANSGAAFIGSESVTDITGTTIRAQLVDLRNKLKAITDGSSGADFINATAIAGWTGSTVQALLESAKAYIDTFVSQTSNIADSAITTIKLQNLAVTAEKIANLTITASKIADNAVTTTKIADGAVTDTQIATGTLDGRYFTETELQSTTTGTSGADKIGSGAISGVTGTTVYTQMASLKSQVDFGIMGQIPDGSITDIKLSDASADIKSRFTALSADNVYLHPTGTANDTSYVQAAITGHACVTFTPGVYLIDAVTKLTIPSNRNIYFQKGAVLQVITNSSDSYRVMDLFAAENVNIYDPEIIGDRDTHIGVTGEQGHGIVISTGVNINIFNPKISDCWGDAITIYGGTNVYIENVNLDNCRRQGISITSADGLTIEGGIISNINGTLPMCGIDIEPNAETDKLKNIKINNITTDSCEYYGIMIVPQNIMTTVHEISIEINNHKDYGSTLGFCLAGMRPTVQMSGLIINKDCYYKDNLGEGIRLLDYQYAYSPLMRILNPTVINPNVSASAVPRYGGAGICVFRETTYAGTLKMGNFTIERATIIDDRAVPLMLKGIYFYDAKSVGCQGIQVIDPIRISGVAVTNMIDVFSNITDGVSVYDPYHVTLFNAITQFNSFINNVYSKITNTGLGVSAQWNINTVHRLDSSVEFVNSTTYGTLIYPPANSNIVPLSTVVGKYIQTTEVGASIKIRRLSSTSYVIEDMIGTWIVQDALLTGSTTWNPASLADGAGETSASIAVSGAVLGDFVVVSAPYDLQGITCNGYVDVAGSVKIRIQNETGGVIDLASGTWKVKVFK